MSFLSDLGERARRARDPAGYQRNQILQQSIQSEQQQDDQKAQTLGLLNAGDYLMQGDVRGALNYVNQFAQDRMSQGLDASKAMEFAKRLQGIQTPQQLQEAARELQMVRQRAIRSGVVNAPQQQESGFDSIVTGSDGRRYGIPKSNPQQGYVPVPSPEGVAFKSGEQNINVNTGNQSNAFIDSMVEGATGSLSQFREEAQAAGSKLNAIRSLKGLDVSTGFGTRARTNLARMTNFFFGEGAGDVFSDEVPAAQAFQALSQKMVNEELNAAKGPQTEGDAIRARETVASLDKEGPANQFLLSYYEGLALRAQERNSFFNSRMNVTGEMTNQAGLQSYQQAEDAWLEYKQRTPLVAPRRQDGKTLVYAGSRIPMVYYDFEKSFMQNNAKQLQGMPMKEKREAAQQAWREANGIQ